MIVSKSNETIKKLVSLKDKKYREKYKMYIVEGLKLAEEIIDSKGKTPFEFVIYSEEIVSKINGYESLREKLEEIDKNKIIEVSDVVFEQISDTVTPQGVLVVLPIKKKSFIDFKENIEGKYIILDKVQDAGNMGTIIRSAVSFGVDNIICTKGTVDIYSPKVVRSTMGAIEKINIFFDDVVDIFEYIKALKDKAYVMVSTCLEANKALGDLKKSYKNVYVFGNEASGISKELKLESDELIKIEMENTQESLNVSQAATICMYEEYINS